ncbi:mitochondrial glycoprotein [Podospora australis]|uniref:Mitochondrial glycoprotein n=1 Tax=Podospora australis TaxID=1536484 RepID=A0AAN6X1C7_9PEZI|nr:mitochondrial glycoprotein [Podospora australis]
MMSLRAIARSAPRALARASAGSSLRTSTTSNLLRTAARPTTSFLTQRASAFSTTVLRKAPAGEVDEELSAKLSTELEYENSVKEHEVLPASIKDFVENGPFEIVDVPGKEDVILTRTFGNEKITVSFSISDLSNYQEPYEDDAALADEELDEIAAEQRNKAQESEEDLDEDLEGAGEAAIPVRLNVVVEKPGKGALNVEAIAEDGSIVVENVYYYKDAKLAHSSDAEAVHAAQDAYPGPAFGSLDEDLQILMERYLEERGITPALATFVPDYMDMKEQKEYIAWLENVKGFVDA